MQIEEPVEAKDPQAQLVQMVHQAKLAQLAKQARLEQLVVQQRPQIQLPMNL